MKRREAMRRWLPWLGFALFGAAACQVVVGETELTTVNCRAEGAVGPPACAVGQVCLSGVCVSESSAADGGGGTSGSGGTGDVGGTGGGGTGGGDTGGTGGTGDHDAGDASDTGFDAPEDGVPPEVGPDVPTDTPVDSPPDVEPDAPLIDFGVECTDHAQCESKLCVRVPGLGISVCARHCCNSVECPSGAVCALAYGGNVCYPAGLVSLGEPGSGPVGSSCGAGADCRSSRCVGSVCSDVCCSSASCAGKACTWQGTGWFCGTNTAGSGKANAQTCPGGDSECDGNNCVTWLIPDLCMGPCCKDSDCGSGYCDYYKDGNAIQRQCYPVLYSEVRHYPPCCRDADCPSGMCRPLVDETFSSGVLGPPFDTADVEAMRCVP